MWTALGIVGSAASLLSSRKKSCTSRIVSRMQIRRVWSATTRQQAQARAAVVQPPCRARWSTSSTKPVILPRRGQGVSESL
jgi:hypothetical protein